MSSLQDKVVEPAVTLVIDGPVATLTLSRPRASNAIDVQMARSLRDAARQLSERPDVTVVVLAGEGDVFCGGGDIRYFADNIDEIGPAIRELLDIYHGFLNALHVSSKLVVSSAQGAVAGAGFSLVMMSDFCIASDDCRLVPAYAQLGVSPDGGGSYGLVRAVGPRRALQIILGEQQITAQQALAWGLVYDVVPRAALAEATMALARRLAKTSAEAIRGTKALMARSGAASLGDQLIDEMDALVRCCETDAFRAGVARFINKG